MTPVESSIPPPDAKTGFAALPTWAQVLSIVGIPGFISLYLIGAIPGMTGPLQTFQGKLDGHSDVMISHDKEAHALNRKILDGLMAICIRLPDKPNAPRCGG